MASMIEVWEIGKDGKLILVDSTLAANNRTEPEHLEGWLSANPTLIAKNIRLIGRQVVTKTGELDLLAIDSSGNVIVIELKRDKLPREALAQAIDYASDISSWDIAKLSEECSKFNRQTLEEYFGEQFPNVNIEDIVFNSLQRIILVGFRVEDSLQRMVEWLFDKYSVVINVVTLKYIRTTSGEELLARTAIFNEEVEKSKVGRKFVLAKSDDPGAYDVDTLRQKLLEYFEDKRKVPQAIRSVLLKLCLISNTVTRDMIKKELVQQGLSPDIQKSFTMVANISTQMGLEKNDFLRQVVVYSYPVYEWEKDNYQLVKEYKELVKEVLA
ncbi:MAG: hypothetical protein A2505_00540 [Deltaproteobacteria bacterium RIFOXYD12_FULL_55_16]|nr:MAG: hypothetical protein A2505_00540 [Deltaproteobacteria bacterium RIFOXYD12_FULL_55_16]